MSVLVIAEPGCTHEGSYEKLVQLLETAAACGANVFKPQWVSDPVAMCERRHIGPEHEKRAYYERAYGWLKFPVDWHADLRDRCKLLGMQYACTVFLTQDVATIAPFVDYLKISSFEANDEELSRAWWPHRRRVILSTGMQGAGLGLMPVPFGLLHCVTSYPSPPSAMNLRVFDDSNYEYNGLSDHSRHLLTGSLAVALGAEIIETHYRLDACDPNNPDHAVAFTPAEFTQYVKNIRDAELMLGDGVKRVQPCEAWALPYRVVT